IIIRGKAEKPVYLKIIKDRVEIEDADDLWGRGSFETEDILMDRRPKARVASIGPAGENKVRFACINTDKYRQFGRGGAGAVMGSKNLKALVLEGQEKFFIHDEQKFNDLAVGVNKKTVKHPDRIIRHKLGTPLWIRLGHEEGRFLSTHNFKYGQWKDYESLTSETMQEELKWKPGGCYNCVIKCSKKVTYDGGDFEGPEFETASFLGSGCEVSDARAVAKANSMCDDLGLDTISCGVTISFATEAAEKGLFSLENNEWIKFGSADAVLKLVKKIAFREDIGDVLAEGTRIASKIIGQNCDHFAIQIGGMELSGVNPLGCYSMALSLATADFASHTRMWSATDEMLGNLDLDTLVPYLADGHDKTNIRNSIIVCDFLPVGLDALAPILEAATGYPFSEEDLLLAGERIQTLSRLYNLRTGRSHPDDVLPARFYQEESCGGLMNGKKISRVVFENHVQDYFKFRGWDK
ncbi:MAG: hypothetical protein GY846_15150, partial [Deltaproteobacteria bacterium]|nr:hypothetical protein [Deltaproteobacteria bacterium]